MTDAAQETLKLLKEIQSGQERLSTDLVQRVGRLEEDVERIGAAIEVGPNSITARLEALQSTNDYPVWKVQVEGALTQTKNDLSQLKKDVKEIQKADEEQERKIGRLQDGMQLLSKIVYGACGVVLMTVLGAIVALVVMK